MKKSEVVKMWEETSIEKEISMKLIKVLKVAEVNWREKE